MACINCNIDFEGDFCPSCGEKKNIDRITFISIVKSVFSGFADMDKGFLFNIKNLTRSPQKTILEYIKGKRRNVLNPVSYAIITISIYIIITILLKKTPDDSGTSVKKIEELGKFAKIGYKTGGVLFDKLKFFWLFLAFYVSIFSKLFFKRFNFFEHLAINSFIVGHVTLVAIIVKIIYPKEIIVFNFLVFFYMIFMMYKVFLQQKNKFEIATMASIVVVFAYILFMALPFLLANFL